MSQMTKNKPRLGRGLSSLISVSNLPVEAEIRSDSSNASVPALPAISAVSPPANGDPLLVSVDLIRPNPHQPRKTINQEAIAELADSMKSSGIIQPLVVRRIGSDFELIAGHRRLQAAKLAGLTDVPVIVRDVDNFTQAQLALVENIQREDLNPIERAQGYRALMDQLGLTQAELAGRMGEERSGIANYLRLLELSEGVRELVREGKLSFGHAKLLAGVSDILRQKNLADTVVSQGLSVRNLERLLQSAASTIDTKKPTGSAAHVLDLERSITRQLGMRVQLRSNAKGKGRLILHYTSLDQFDMLLEKLGVKAE
jgi:ParB family transcriptional regulator, chromosome partitioning protein